MTGVEGSIGWTPELRAQILPRRDGEVRPVEADPAAAWGRMRQRFALTARAWKRSRSLSEGSLGPVVRAAIRKMEQAGDGLPPAADPEVEGALLVMLSLGDGCQKPALDGEIVTVWAATGGLSFAVEALQASLRFQLQSSSDKLLEVWLNRKSVGGAVAKNREAGFRHWWHLRHRLAAAGEAEWTAARDTAERLRTGATLDWRVPLAYLFPETGWAEEDAREAAPSGSEWKCGFLVPVVRDADLLDRLLAKAGSGWLYVPSALEDDPGCRRKTLLTVVDNLGASAVALLARLLDSLHGSLEAEARRQVLDALALIGTTETAEALADRLEIREVPAALAAFAACFPRVALPMLAARAVRGGPVIAALLSQVVRRHRQVAAELLPGLTDASRRMVEALLAATELPPEARSADLPPVLASLPRKRRKPPSFWQPDDFTRPLLHGRTAALPPAAVEALGALLAASSLDEPHAGLDQVREACDPASLAAFAWDLFAGWLAAEAPNKEQWAFHALGHFGDDACARRLAPMIREWPGASAHARAVAGVDVLRAIGTDIALMHLHGIAQRIRFKGLQDKAREKIAEIAARRGLTPDELADRLAPDLGLGADGTLVLDFGPRSFHVGFDETLKPFVRDMGGKRLPDLPKPVQTDDAEKARQAQEAWKTLKKDAKALAAQQILRLELAMCSRRRWKPDIFRVFFLEHPLLQHLVRRLVWGAWYGDGRLAGTFRVGEDNRFADIADDVWEFTEGSLVGIVHRLDLTDQQAMRWSGVFADYEILQPFSQLGREIFPITDEERGARELRRLEGVAVHTGRVLGLVDQRGWRRGPAQENGVIWWLARLVPGDHEARLNLDPGILVEMVMELPEQTLGTVTIEQVGAEDDQGGFPFGTLDPITFSELVRDLEGLR